MIPSLELRHGAAKRLHNLVMLGSAPKQHRLDLAEQLLQETPSEPLGQTLIDFLSTRGACRLGEEPAPTVAGALVEWLGCLQQDALGSGEAVADHLVSRFQSAPPSQRDAWLLAAASMATGKEVKLEELGEALAQIPRDHALARTALYHRARLLLAQQRPEEARVLLDQALGLEPTTLWRSDENKIRFLRAQTATTLDELITDSLQTPIASSYWEGVGRPARELDRNDLERPMLIGAATQVLNRRVGFARAS